MAIKEKDFVEIEYTGRAEDITFDTTDKRTAEDEGILNKDMEYGPVIICVGEKHVIEGLDNFLVGKEPGDFNVEIKPEEAFGKKNPKLLKLIPTSVFTKQQINPMPGLQVNIDNAIGTIRSVTGGRTFVDFNHPLSGKTVSYELKVKRVVTDDKEKVTAIMKMQFGGKSLEVDLVDGKATVKVPMDIPEEARKKIEDKVKELIPNVKELVFAKTEQKAEEKGKEK